MRGKEKSTFRGKWKSSSEIRSNIPILGQKIKRSNIPFIILLDLGPINFKKKTQKAKYEKPKLQGPSTQIKHNLTFRLKYNFDLLLLGLIAIQPFIFFLF